MVGLRDLTHPASAFGMHQTAQRQPRHVANVAVGEVTITAHSQHRADTFQKNRTALNRHRLRNGHDNFQLGVDRAMKRATGEPDPMD